MKKRIVLYVGCAAVAILFLSAGSMLFRKPLAPKPDTELVMRQIGHRLLLASGDSSSRVLPVKKTGNATFQISFENPFSFSPDSLSAVVQRCLAAANMPQAHRVHVIECNTPDIVYGYQIGSAPAAPLVPCNGRTQPVGCYVVQIVLEPEAHAGSNVLGAGLIFFSGVIVMLAFVGVKLRSANKVEHSVIHEEAADNEIRLGVYNFYPEKSMLKNGRATTQLSDKENRLLVLLVAHRNTLVERDRLMKDIWEDDGVFVGRSLDVFVSRLRKKLSEDSSIRIVNIHGKGYRLETGVHLG